jgi:hypothetical protein
MKSTILAVTLAAGLVNAGASAEMQMPEQPPAKAKGKATRTTAPPRPIGTAGKPTSVQLALNRDPDLADRIAQRLPPRIDVMWASSGFRNLGQFVAAVNAADNLQIPFMTLKSRMLDEGMSLGEAIRDLRRSSDYKKEARRAEDEAKAMMRKR